MATRTINRRVRSIGYAWSNDQHVPARPAVRGSLAAVEAERERARRGNGALDWREYLWLGPDRVHTQMIGSDSVQDILGRLREFGAVTVTLAVQRRGEG